MAISDPPLFRLRAFDNVGREPDARPASMSTARSWNTVLADQWRRSASFMRHLAQAGPMVAAELAGWVRPRYPKLVELLRAFDHAGPPPQVLYLGDSVVERVAREDTDRHSLASMVIDRFGPQTAAVSVSHMGYHTGVYHGLLRVLQTTRHRPELVILPLNLRSFGPRWFLDPVWQFHHEIRALQRYLAHPFRGIPRLRETIVTAADMEAFEAIDVEFPETDFRCIGQFHEVMRSTPQDEAEVDFRRRQIFILHYMHALRAEHPRLRSLEEALGLLSHLGCSVLCYVTPVNHDAGLQYVGPAFQDALRRNVLEIRRIVERQGRPDLRFEDFSEFLDPTEFFSTHDAAEHLNERGRSHLAAAIVGAAEDSVKDHLA